MKIKREVKIAITFIVALFILVWGINFLRVKSIFDSTDKFYAVYDRVDGLKVSSSVVYRGYKVGQIDKITFIGERFSDVLVSFIINHDLRIPENTVAKIASADIMGTKEIQLIPGDAMVYAESGDTLIGKGDVNIIQQINEQLEPMKQKAIGLMNSVDSVMNLVQSLFDDGQGGNMKDAVYGVKRTIDNLEQATGRLNTFLKENDGKFTHIVTNVDSLVDVISSNKDNISEIIGNFADITDSLDKINIVAKFNGILSKSDSILIAINSGTGSLNKLLYSDELVYNLNEILTGFNNNPKKYVNLSIFGSSKVREYYGVAVRKSDKPLYLTDQLYVTFPDLKEIRKDNCYYYITAPEKKISGARKNLSRISASYPDAFIVKF